MVNSLKHALELPRSSAMNNQDKCDPDWIGWHVLYGVLIPLYIVVGFSCSKTKHRTSLSVSESSTHLTLALFFFTKPVSKGKWELPRSASPRSTKTVPTWRLPPGPSHMSTGKDPKVWAPSSSQLHQALPGHAHLHFQTNHLKVSKCRSKYLQNAKVNSSSKKPLTPSNNPHSSDQHSSAERLVKLCYLTAAEDYLDR